MQSIGYLYNFYKKKASLDFYCKCQIFLFVFPTNAESASFLQDFEFQNCTYSKITKIGVKKALCMIKFFQSYFQLLNTSNQNFEVL